MNVLLSYSYCRPSTYWMHTRSFHRFKQIDSYISFISGGKPMSIPSLRSIPRSKPGLHSFMNTTLVKLMVKISLDGVQMIRLMRHGGTSLLKVRIRKCIFWVCIKSETFLRMYLAMEANPSLVAVSFSKLCAKFFF